MRQASWGFLAGMAVMTAIVVVELWSPTPQPMSDLTGYDTGTAVDLRDC